MKKRTIILLVVMMIQVWFISAYADNQSDKSLGTTAGETARNLTDKTNETVQKAAVETKQASEQVQQTANDTFQKLSADFQTTMKNLQDNSQELLKRLQEEWEKFKQAYNKPKP